jgi:hypothetical protein
LLFPTVASAALRQLNGGQWWFDHSWLFPTKSVHIPPM